MTEHSRCKGTNKRGEPCKAAAMRSGYCYLHSDPSRAAQLGREGGRRNRHFIEDTARPLPTLDSITNIRNAVSSIIEDIYTGRVHPRKAAAMAPLLGVLLRASTGAELEQRMERLEGEVRNLSSGQSEKGELDHKSLAMEPRRDGCS